MRFPWGRTSAIVVLTASVALSQSAPAPSCDALLAEQYRQLVTDQVLAPPPPGQPVEMPQYLGTMTTALRALTLQYYEKVQQALTAEGQAARQRIELQQLRQQVQALSAEVAELKQPKEPLASK